LSKYEEMEEDLRVARADEQELWTIRFRQAEAMRTQLERELQAAQKGVTSATPRTAAFEVDRQQLERRLARAESRLARSEASSFEREFQVVHRAIDEAKKSHADLLAGVQEKQTQLMEQMAERSKSILVVPAITAVPSPVVPSISPVQREGAVPEDGVFNGQKGHERSPLSPKRSTSPSTSVTSLADEQRSQDLRAMLDDVQRSVRAPRGSGMSVPLSPTSLSQASSPEGAPRRSSPSFSITRDGMVSEESLPSDSMLDATVSPNQNSFTINRSSVAQNLAPRLEEQSWLLPVPPGELAAASLASSTPSQSRLQWLKTPPRTQPPRTPPRSRSVSQEVFGGSSSAAAEIPAAGRPGPRSITAARASALWRQQTLSEHDAERRNLQQRVEQMRRQIDAERSAAPRRNHGLQ
jgi:hypothetical protein